VAAIFQQLGLDYTFFLELGIFLILFLFLSKFYFKPFLKLLETRYQRTVADKEKAEQLMAEAQAKWNEYKGILSEARVGARTEFETAMKEVKKQEAEELTKAREEAKRITQQTAEEITHQRVAVKKQLDSDVEILSQTISEKLLSRQGK
jgi:F-type H+-transporting ATPase subunit b